MHGAGEMTTRDEYGIGLILLSYGGAWLIITMPAAQQKCSWCDANSNV